MLAYCDQLPEARHDRTMAEEICRRVRCPVKVNVEIERFVRQVGFAEPRVR